MAIINAGTIPVLEYSSTYTCTYTCTGTGSMLLQYWYYNTRTQYSGTQCTMIDNNLKLQYRCMKPRLEKENFGQSGKLCRKARQSLTRKMSFCRPKTSKNWCRGMSLSQLQYKNSWEIVGTFLYPYFKAPFLTTSQICGHCNTIACYYHATGTCTRVRTRVLEYVLEYLVLQYLPVLEYSSTY